MQFICSQINPLQTDQPFISTNSLMRLAIVRDRLMTIIPWRCCQRGHKCFRSSLCPAGLLSKVSCSMWLPFLYFSNAMRLNYRWSKIQSELQSMFGNSFSDKTMRRWRTLYQSSLQNCLLHQSSMIVGATPGDVVVFDETNLGSQRGISKSSSSGRSSERTKAMTSQRVAKRLPAQTVHRRPAAHLRRPAATPLRRPTAAPLRRPAAAPLRRPAAVMKSVFNKHKVGAEKDTRSQGPVLVGNKKTRHTRENGKHVFPLPSCQSLLLLQITNRGLLLL